MTDQEKRIRALLDYHANSQCELVAADKADLRALLANLDKARASADELLAFVSEYLEAWANGMAGDSYLRRQAEALLGEATGEQPK